MKELISVIVPVYNVEKYLRRCVDSILKQTYQNLEILLVDDGSTDGCAAICDDYGRKDVRVRVIHKENGGLSSARNVGIDAAMGELLAFVDSDDFIEAEMLEMLYRTMCSCDADMTICNLRYVDEEGIQIASRPANIIRNECIGPVDYWERVLAGYGLFYVVAWNKLYRRKLWENLRYPEGKINEDEFVLHRLVDQCVKIGGVSYVGYYYVQRPGSIMAQKKKIANFDLFEAWIERIRYFHSTDRDDFARTQITLFGERLSSMYSLCKMPEEKKTYHRIAKEYTSLQRQLYQGLSVPVKERIKNAGCRWAPWLINFVWSLYYFLWTKTWKCLHGNGGKGRA